MPDFRPFQYKFRGTDPIGARIKLTFFKKNFRSCHIHHPCLVIVPDPTAGTAGRLCGTWTNYGETTMFKSLYKYMIVKFGNRYGYDVGYMLFMLENTPSVMNSLNALSKLSGYRKKAPADCHMAARLQGVLNEDCGPCLQLTVDMAREAGMAPDQIEAVLTGNRAAMSDSTALGWRFAAAIINRSTDEFAAREAVRAAHGDAAVIELTLAAQASRLFPMIKTGLGAGKSCSRVTIGEQAIMIGKQAA